MKIAQSWGYVPKWSPDVELGSIRSAFQNRGFQGSVISILQNNAEPAFWVKVIIIVDDEFVAGSLEYLNLLEGSWIIAILNHLDGILGLGLFVRGKENGAKAATAELFGKVIVFQSHVLKDQKIEYGTYTREC